MIRIELSRTEPDIEIGVMGGDSGTIHFFRFKSLDNEVVDIDSINQEEENKFTEFFKKLKIKVLPSVLSYEASQLKIRLDPKTTLG